MEENKSIIAIVTDEAKRRGHDVRIRDIAYAILRMKLDDSYLAYNVVFGVPKDKDIEAYESLASNKFLYEYFVEQEDEARKKIEKDTTDDDFLRLMQTKKVMDINDISFEENKAAMVELIQRTEDALAANKIDTDKGLKIIADLRVKLNDKFGASEKSNEQYIVVQPKFNTVCPHTRKECWEMTEEYAMNKFHLIKDPKFKK